MSLAETLMGKDINEGVRIFENTPGAVLLDVRTPGEYAERRIPGSINVPLQELPLQISRIIPEKNTPVFVHCLSGGRSHRAVVFLEKQGYTNVVNIGGISAYTGKTQSE